MCDAKCNHPVDKIHVFPDKEDIANAWENKAQENTSAVVMLFLQSYPLKADKSTETKDWKNFKDGSKDSWFLSFWKPCHKVYTHSLQKWHKFRTNTFNLLKRKNNISTNKELQV